ncbi:MAG: pterin-4-alpha-carbinolamine dehydratase, partial [Flavobacteriales bacterium]|nr:pterin-4-alpha-carbinolamine dehydratase [Flavobacteriales bacterium]
MKKLTKSQIEEKMKSFEGWDYGENAIHTSL